DDLVEVYTDLADYKRVQEALAENYEIVNAELAWIPQSTVMPGEKEALQTMKLIEALEELDDVQQVYSNLEITDEMVTKYEEQAA
ncbi:MAG: YebC/PmpR family DNA-binding transcriptional regulator, partial [Chloroflexi bacterium]|nr:YebC/PmpR family DNA-binding transcriptional regulator [Chloroflexota bacterium]